MTDRDHSKHEGGEPTYADYASPDALLADDTVAQGRKIDILRVWERDMRQLMVAEGEGLPDAAGSDAANPERLKQISDALQRLGADERPDHAQSDVSGSSTT